jgi:hypothetical protein
MAFPRLVADELRWSGATPCNAPSLSDTFAAIISVADKQLILKRLTGRLASSRVRQFSERRNELQQKVRGSFA